jgi:hypothetical protein
VDLFARQHVHLEASALMVDLCCVHGGAMHAWMDGGVARTLSGRQERPAHYRHSPAAYLSCLSSCFFATMPQ